MYSNYGLSSLLSSLALLIEVKLAMVLSGATGATEQEGCTALALESIDITWL